MDIQAERTTFAVQLEIRNNRPYLYGRTKSGERFEISPPHYRPHQKNGPNGLPLVCVKVSIWLDHKNRLIHASTLDQKEAISLIPSSGFDITPKGKRIATDCGDYLMAEVINPQLLKDYKVVQNFRDEQTKLNSSNHKPNHVPSLPRKTRHR